MPWRCLCCFRLKGRKIPTVYAVQELLEQLGFAASLGVEGKPCCLTRDPACLIRIPRYTRTSQKTAEELLCHFWD